ncbi:hypothetical protein AB0B28_08110 [Glycomyces sp. NPDC046736]|uniref:hypothetical protein n=1 Tax=Glycomyces sp. NPDC046736 TaxID=3155615 RepID=UPI003405FC39
MGAPTPTSVRVTGEIDGAMARLAVSTNQNLDSPQWVGPVPINAAGTVHFSVEGLAPATEYWCAIEDDGTLDTDPDRIGRFTTFRPTGSTGLHRVVGFGDAGLTPDYPAEDTTVLPSTRGSNPPVLSQIAGVDADLRVCLGDWHYGNPGDGVYVPDGTVGTIRAIYRDVLRQPHQAAVLRVPTEVGYDDHDFVGGNDSDGTSLDKPNLAQVVREFMPHYPMGAAGPVYRAWQIDRTLHILADTRYDRTPNGAADNASKTMLGQAQKDWMRSILTTTTAVALVWWMPTPWLGGHVDTWSSFTTERQELATMLTSIAVPSSGGTRSWASSMVMLTADVHALGLASGAANPWGGFPVLLCASIDATPSEASGSQYDLGFQGGRSQWGMVTVDDTGSQITMTLTGYSGMAVWRQHTISFATGQPTPPPAPTPVPGATATATNRVDWYACDLVSGAKIAHLPMVKGTFGRALSNYWQTTLTLPLPTAGPGRLLGLADRILEPRTTMYVAVVNGVPAWAGILLKPIGGTAPTAELGLVSLEGYLNRRYVGDHKWTGVDEARIWAGLIGDANNEHGIGLVVDAPDTGTVRDREYFDDENGLVFQRVSELAEVEDGPDWTIDLEWTNSRQTHVRKVARLRKRIGRVDPIVTLSSISPVYVDYDWTWDYSDGRGANDILAYTSGEGEDTPTSARIRDEFQLDAGIPRYEYRFQPSSSIKNPSVLNAHARRKLAELREGTKSVVITCRANIEPARLGVDWNIGDTVNLDLWGHLDPLGRAVRGRVLAWELDPEAQIVKPTILLEA